MRYQDVDERTTLYLVLALRDRHRLLGCPADARALTGVQPAVPGAGTPMGLG